MIKFLVIIILTLIPLLSANALECDDIFSSPITNKQTVDELIKESKGIVLAKAVSAKLSENKYEYSGDKKPEYFKFSGQTFHSTEYKLSNMENIKGDNQNNFKDFDAHTEQSFWNSDGGRLTGYLSCHFLPNFELGYFYLIFLDNLEHNKSFELITDVKNDKWLQYVRDKVKEQAQ